MFQSLLEDFRFLIIFTIFCAFILWYNLGLVLNILNNSHYGKVKYILVTGCDTGIGRSIALNLTRDKCKVFAGCLTNEGVEELENDKEFDGYPFLMDVTKIEDVERTRAFIEETLKPNEGEILLLAYFLYWYTT